MIYTLRIYLWTGNTSDKWIHWRRDLNGWLWVELRHENHRHHLQTHGPHLQTHGPHLQTHGLHLQTHGVRIDLNFITKIACYAEVRWWFRCAPRPTTPCTCGRTAHVRHTTRTKARQLMKCGTWTSSGNLRIPRRWTSLVGLKKVYRTNKGTIEKSKSIAKQTYTKPNKHDSFWKVDKQACEIRTCWYFRR